MKILPEIVTSLLWKQALEMAFFMQSTLMDEKESFKQFTFYRPKDKSVSREPMKDS